jgi:phospholipase/lecithinase/hemolysin
MKDRKTLLFAASVAVMLLAFTAIASANPYSSVIVYGDSLSDNGNLYAAIGYPPSPYYNGRFSNGPVAVEQLATQLSATLYDFAWGGATSGTGNYIDGGSPTTFGALGLPGMFPELSVSSSLVSSLNLSSSLFVVWGGANDFLTGGSPAQAAWDIDLIVSSLQSAGATHILVPNMPNLGLTPDYYGDAAATAYAVGFNAFLQASLPSGASYFDTFSLMQQIENNPAAYGFTDVTDPCFNGVSVCSNPSQYLFWDGFHPTTQADAIVANQFAETPEPSSILMLGTGLAGLVVLLRRQRMA